MNASTAGAGDSARAALIAGISCYAMWGFIPLAFQQMGHVGADAWEIMGHRAVWAVPWAGALVLAARPCRVARTSAPAHGAAQTARWPMISQASAPTWPIC